MNKLDRVGNEVSRLKDAVSAEQNVQIGLLSAILDEVAYGVVIRNLSGVVVFENESARKMLNGEANRLPFAQAFTDKDVHQYRLNISGTTIECDARQLRKPYENFAVAIIHNGKVEGLKRD